MLTQVPAHSCINLGLPGFEGRAVFTFNMSSTRFIVLTILTIHYLPGGSLLKTGFISFTILTGVNSFTCFTGFSLVQHWPQMFEKSRSLRKSKMCVVLWELDLSRNALMDFMF